MKFPLNVFQLHGFLSTNFLLLTTEIVILFDNILLLPKTFTPDTYTSNTRCIGQGWWIRKSHLSSMLLYTYTQYIQTLMEMKKIPAFHTQSMIVA